MRNVQVAPGETVTDVVFRLHRTAVITGRVTGENGEPAPYANIQVLQPGVADGQRQPRSAGGGTTNDLGEYRVFGLEPGEYYVQMTYQRQLSPAVVIEGLRAYPPQYFPAARDWAQATLISLRSGEVRSGVDFRLSGSPAFRVTGRVVGSGAASHVGVTLTAGDGRSPFPTGWGAGPAGEFTIPGVPPGDYVLTARTVSGSISLMAGCSCGHRIQSRYID